MAAGHHHALHLDGNTGVHRLAPQVKIVAMSAYTLAVVATPRQVFWAFGAYALLLVPIAVLARVPALWLLRRCWIELPFVLLAFLLPFTGVGDRTAWFGLSLSVDGLYGGWNLFAKATLGVLASLMLAATTTPRDLIAGLERLRCPQSLTMIATFMLRYLDVLVGEARRMRVARISRGDDPRFLWQLRGFAAGIGALFLRAYERGERVYLAMLSRGYDGRMPDTSPGDRAGTRQWLAAATLGVPAVGVAVTAAVLG